MMKKIVAELFLGVAVTGLVQAADLTLSAGNLTLEAEASGKLTGFQVNRQEYLNGAQQPFSAFDAATGEQESFSGTFSSNERGELLFRGEAPELKLALEAVYAPLPGRNAFLVQVELQDLTSSDRAIRLQYDLNLKAAQWRFGSNWDRSPNGAISCHPGNSYSQIETINGVPVSQPPWLLADDGSNGIMFAHSMMKPRFFSYIMRYSETQEATLSWQVPLGLTPETAKFPSRAGLEFLLGSFDGRYSARGGMQAYYDAFPEIYRSRLQDRGAWALWIPTETIDTARKCGMLLNQREWDLDFRSNPELAVKLWKETQAAGLKVLLYSEPWGIYMPFPKDWIDQNSTGPAPSSYQTAADTGKMKALFEPDADDNAPSDRFPGTLTRSDIVKIVENCAIEYTPQGDWRLNAYGRGGFIWEGPRKNQDTGMLILNSDPDLPRPNRNNITWEQARYGYIFEQAGKYGLKVDGLYLDSELFYAGWNEFNFRRDHWKYADVPLTYTVRDGKPYIAQHMSLANNDFLVWNRQEADKRGLFVAGNVWNPLVQFVVPYVDMVGVGEHWDPKPENFAGMINEFKVFRNYSGNKLLSTMDYVLNFGGGVPETPEAVESVMEPRLNACLMYGIWPGTANAWAFPEKVAMLVPLFERYVPIFDAITAAQWQVIPHLEVKGDGADVIFRERWGKSPAEGLFFTLHNPDAESKTVTLEWNLADFGGKEFASITEMVGKKNIEFQLRDGKATAELEIPARRTVALEVK